VPCLRVCVACLSSVRPSFALCCRPASEAPPPLRSHPKPHSLFSALPIPHFHPRLAHQTDRHDFSGTFSRRSAAGRLSQLLISKSSRFHCLVESGGNESYITRMKCARCESHE
jgi:hypothetical protein